VGFAAETQRVIEHAQEKRLRKGCDWILANDVSAGSVFGQGENEVHLIDAAGVESWPRQDKQQVARRLAERIARHLGSVPA
jgi:phosphopantothenoylcysteine decarboxylase/phosphopantothenate--cysteine ligase